MKKLFLLSVFSLYFIISYAENFRGVTTNCLLLNQTTRKWEYLEDGEGIQVLCDENRKLYIFSKKIQIFTLLHIKTPHINPSGHLQCTSNAIDQDNINCFVRFVYRDDIEAPLQIYIHYNNIEYVYNIIPLN